MESIDCGISEIKLTRVPRSIEVANDDFIDIGAISNVINIGIEEDQIGVPCDDGNPETTNDQIAEDCECLGEIIFNDIECENLLSIPDTSFCPGDPVAYRLNLEIPAASQYSWTTTEELDNILSANSFFVATELDVQYVVRVSIEDDSCSELIDTFVLTEINPPIVELILGRDGDC